MSSFKVKGFPWAHGIGKNVSDCNTAAEVMDKAGLNFTVDKCPVVAKMPFRIGSNNELNEYNGDFSYGGDIYRSVSDCYATYRTDLNIPLGMVGAKYEVVQNRDAFSFFDDAIGKDKAQWEYAGLFGAGHKIYIAAKLPADIDVKGDPVSNYLVFSNSHDGSSSVDVMFTPIRMFCINCLSSAINSASSAIRLKHTKTVNERLEYGKRILASAIQYAENTKQLYEALAVAKLSDETVMQYITRLVLTDDEITRALEFGGDHPYNKLVEGNWYVKTKAEISTRKINKLASIWDYYQNGPGQDRIVGTAWGAYNSITGYFANIANTEGEKRMDGLVWGSASRSMRTALSDVIELAETA